MSEPLGYKRSDVKLILNVAMSYILTMDKISLENMKDDSEILSTNSNTVRILTLYTRLDFLFRSVLLSLYNFSIFLQEA